MKYFSSISEKIIYLVCLLFATVYFYSLPNSIQGGDTAELVGAAKYLYVAHPPGYPLWVWIQSAWLNIINAGSIFWRSSLLAAIYSLFTLYIIALPLKTKPFQLILTAMTLGLSTAFFESALLPDVFSLHALLTATIGYFYLFEEKTSYKRQVLIPFVFCLGVAHHHTIIFLLPIVLFVFIENIKDKKLRNAYILSTMAGTLLTIILYASLTLMHPENYYSWAKLTDARTAFNHFLRSDYGTFSFAPSKDAGLSSFEFDSINYFFKLTLYQFAPLCISCALAMTLEFRKFATLKNLVWALSLILSISFFLMTNFKMQGMGLEIIKRFHVMPAVLLALGCSYILKTCELTTKSFKALLLISFFSILPWAPHNIKINSSLRSDTLLEEYSQNILKMADYHNASLIVVTDDNSYFGLKFLQMTDRRFEKIAVVSPSLFFHPWYYEKVKNRLPEFQLKNSEQIWSNRTLNFENDLVDANSSMSILSTRLSVDPLKHKLTFLPLGRLISSGAGTSFNNQYPVFYEKIKNADDDGPQSFSKKFLYSEYSFFYLAQAQFYYQQKNIDLARQSWLKALDIVPYCAPALINICAIDNKTADCSSENIGLIQKQSQFIF